MAVRLSARSAGNEDSKAAGAAKDCVPRTAEAAAGDITSVKTAAGEAGPDVRASQSGHQRGLRGQHRARDTGWLSFSAASFPQPEPPDSQGPTGSFPPFPRAFRGHLPVVGEL